MSCLECLLMFCVKADELTGLADGHYAHKRPFMSGPRGPDPKTTNFPVSPAAQNLISKSNRSHLALRRVFERLRKPNAPESSEVHKMLICCAQSYSDQTDATQIDALKAALPSQSL